MRGNDQWGLIRLAAETIPPVVHQRAAGECAVMMFIDELTDQCWIITTEIDDPVVLGAALQFAGVFLGIVGDQDALDRTGHLSGRSRSPADSGGVAGIQAFFFTVSGVSSTRSAAGVPGR